MACTENKGGNEYDIKQLNPTFHLTPTSLHECWSNGRMRRRVSFIKR